MRRLALAVVALAEWMGSAWAGLNGDGYDWWRIGLLVLMAFTLLLLFVDAPRPPRRAAVPGAVAALVAVVVTTQHFNDSWKGSSGWPDAFACVFFVGVVAVELALVPPRVRR